MTIVEKILVTGVYSGMAGFFVCMVLTVGKILPQDGGLKAGMSCIAVFCVFGLAYVIRHIWE